MRDTNRRSAAAAGEGAAAAGPSSAAPAAGDAPRADYSTVTGRIFEIQRFSVHDGPGIRTTVFLKGCPLRCLWCHNPESQEPLPEISYLPERCIGCGSCVERCRAGAHTIAGPQSASGAHSISDSPATAGSAHSGAGAARVPGAELTPGADGAAEEALPNGGRHLYDRLRCLRCGSCTAECWSGALELVGRTITVEDVMTEVLADESFYRESGGGLTLSGGEPLYQSEFSAELLRRARECGLHTAVETSGFASTQTLMRVRPHTDLFLYDLKETDAELHVRYTGVPLTPILTNLRLLCDSGAALRLRLPIIPGFNDREEHFQAVAQIVASCNARRPAIETVEIMPYHALGTDKHRRFARTTPDGLPRSSVDPSTAVGWRDRLRALGLKVV